ncbi:MAG: GNAT family N-acetyltransferase [Christensenellales bacterium]
MPLEIVPAYRDIDAIKVLFGEYTAMLGVDLAFQNYDEELANLPGEYAPPGGRLYMARCGGQPAGCVALRRFDETCCEMKRLFVRPEFRGRKIGEALARQVMADAEKMRYRAMLLDTMASLPHSISLYRKLGFKETAPYRYNPMPDVLFFRLDFE